MALESWVPLFTKLVWPAVIVAGAAVYHTETGSLIDNINKAIRSGRSLKLADVIEIGAGTPIGDLVNAAAGDLGKTVDLSLNAVGSYQAYVEKGSQEVLNRLKENLRQAPGQTIEILGVRSGHTYSTKLLHSYIESLGIRYIVFQDGDRFAGWMDAGLFNSQLPPPERDEEWPYARLYDELLGRHDQSVPADTKALEVLQQMEDQKVDSIAVLEAGRFKAIVSREGIIAKLLIASVVKPEQKT